ncbi:glycosyltransferase family 4 protein [Candidatus Sumerlaeota bacterium]|nr:glycosyltransferase family 4 protein [Candidatus Sumerlaeota bacterium]
MKKTLNILIANSSRKWIGEAAHTLMLCQHLLKNGHRVWLACRRGWELEKRAHLIDNLQVIPLNMWSRFHPLYDLQDIIKLRDLITRNQIDIVHTHRGKDHWLAGVVMITLRSRPPLIRTRHVTVPLRQHILNKWLYKNYTDAVISVSRQAQKSLGNLIKYFTPERSPVIYSAVDTELFSPAQRSAEFRRQLGLDPDDVLIGLVARFQHIKGQILFLNSAQRVLKEIHPDKKVKFLLTGRDAHRKKRKYKKLIHHIGIADNVILLDEVENIPEVVASLDIGVVASLGSEGSSRISLEYMASGVPIVASAVGGIPELLEDGKTALLVEPGNVEQLATAIMRLIRSPELRERLSQQGLERSRNFFTPLRFISETEQLYFRLLHHRGA